MDFTEEVLRGIIQKSIQQGRLFDLIYSENGRKLWKSWPEKRFRKIVFEELKKFQRR